MAGDHGDGAVPVAVAFDVEKNSAGRFGWQPQAVYEDRDAFTSRAADARLEGSVPVRPEGLGSPAPAPRQVFGIGLNYRDHAAESGLPVPEGEPPVFTRFPSCITGPYGDIGLPPDGHTDWEVDLVVVVGRGTPSGVGLGRNPRRWISDGDVLTSHIEGIGEMRHRFVAASPFGRKN